MCALAKLYPGKTRHAYCIETAKSCVPMLASDAFAAWDPSTVTPLTTRPAYHVHARCPCEASRTNSFSHTCSCAVTQHSVLTYRVPHPSKSFTERPTFGEGCTRGGASPTPPTPLGGDLMGCLLTDVAQSTVGPRIVL